MQFKKVKLWIDHNLAIFLNCTNNDCLNISSVSSDFLLKKFDLYDWDDIDKNFQLFWKDYEDYKSKANKIIVSFENREYDFANLHCVEDLILEYDFRFNCKCLSTRITEHLCMIRSFKFAQDVISEGHWIKNQWSKNSWILSEKEKNNLGMNDISNKIDSNSSNIKNIDGTKNVGNNNDTKNVNVKCYRDNGDGTMDWVNCPVIITDEDNTDC